MKKLASKGTDKLVVSFAIKSFIASVFSIFFFSLLSAFFIYKFDWSLETVHISAIFICALSACIIAYCSVSKLKNNGALMGVLSQLPLLLYSFFNLIFNENSFIFFLIKTVIILLIGALIGFLRANQNKKIKV